MLKKISAIAAVSFALAGCATTPTVTSQTVIVAGVGPVEIERLEVEVASVDPARRRVVVKQGRQTWPVAVPEVFGSLENLRPGDRVEVRRVEGVILDVKRARKGAKPAIIYTEASADSSFQNLPERFVVRSLTVTARFESFDPATNIVSYVGPAGPRTHVVVDPDIQSQLGGLKRGDMVELSFAEAFLLQKS